jgi:hypothetical protein
MKLHGMTVPLSSIAVSAPTTVPTGALTATFKLLIVIVINLSVPHQAQCKGPHSLDYAIRDSPRSSCTSMDFAYVSLNSHLVNTANNITTVSSCCLTYF